MEEYLDIVDEQGNLTGEKELRSIVHEKGLWHRTVHIYFYRNNNSIIELLPHLRSKEKSSHPNCWDTRFGGHVLSGQTPDEGAVREIQEEVGIKIEVGDMLRGMDSSYFGGSNKELTSVYYYNFTDSLNNLSFDDGEVQKVQWMSFREIKKAINDYPEKWTSSKEGIAMIEKELLHKIA